MEEALKEAWIEAGLREGFSTRQHRHGIMAVQAFLMGRQDAEIANPRVAFERFTQQSSRILDENRV